MDTKLKKSITELSDAITETKTVVDNITRNQRSLYRIRVLKGVLLILCAGIFVGTIL